MQEVVDDNEKFPDILAQIGNKYSKRPVGGSDRADGNILGGQVALTTRKIVHWLASVQDANGKCN